MANKKAAAEYDEAETAKRRDEVLRVMLNTPPKPHVARPQSQAKSRKKADAAPRKGRGKSGPDA
jgi:hypothetical protein